MWGLRNACSLSSQCDRDPSLVLGEVATSEGLGKSRGALVYLEFLLTRVAVGQSSQAFAFIPEHLLFFSSLSISCFISSQGEGLCI